MTPGPAMPITNAVDKYASPANLMPPIPTNGAPPPPPAGAPMGMQGAPPPPSDMMATAPTMPSLPAPGDPAQPPYTVRLQADGSSIYVLPSPDGDPAKDIVLSRNEPPKLPKAFQPPAAPKQPGA